MTTPLTYSYSPKALVTSHERLRDKEKELLERASSDAMSTSNNPTTTNTIIVAATQITGAGLPDSDVAGYSFRAEQAIEMAAAEGANLVLLPELWSGPYFCQSQDAACLQLADTVDVSHTLLGRMQLLAKLYNVVLPVSIFERKNNAFYNSVVMIDADGTVLGTYRKSHIPDGTGYQEKFYFTPGDTGFKVFDTKVGKVGVAICWDQWYPEAARCMALQGADVILYPTAIGSEPQDPTLNSADHWQRVMQGHAGANMVPVVASNRFGTEILLRDDGTEQQRITFYGRSFITDNTGAKVAECADNTETEPVQLITAEIDREANRRERAAWGLFRDRRPELYKVLLTKDGG
jgi:N-carbamoylputrescine amidase